MSTTGMESRPSVLELVQSIDAYKSWRKRSSGDSARLGLVPTMGYLHAGHLSLVEKARKECDRVVVSIFVNPLQFAPHEDFDQYPRDLERDLNLLRSANVDCVFNPEAIEIYGAKGTPVTRVTPPSWLTEKLCGTFRPGFFEGVATVVSKLFNIIQPDVAFFGEKDYQQLLVVKKMVADLNMSLAIEGVPIVREADGLAMSSRNVYLAGDARKKAPMINQVLNEVKVAIEEKRATKPIIEAGKKRLNDSGFEVQYLEVCRADDLSVTESVEKPLVVLCAAKLDGVRLIDNEIVR